jgi:amidase
LRVLAGPDDLWDGIGYKLELPPPRHEAISEFRALVVEEHPLCPTADSIRAALENLTGQLITAGCKVSRTSPNMPDMARSTRNYVELLSASMTADVTAEQRARYEAASSALSPDNLSLEAAWTRGATMTHTAWVHTARIREGLRVRWQALFREFDVVLCPAMPTPAFTQDHSPMLSRRLDIDGKQVPYDNQIVWAAIATSTGLPATVAPIGHSESGLPIGVQIIGGYLQDHTTIAFAELIEHAFGGFTPPPL